MFPFHRRAPARLSGALALMLALVSVASAEDSNPVVLRLDEVGALAVKAQPMLKGLDAQVRAAHESAIAAQQLPDPRLIAGIQDLPINGGESYSFTRDTDTQIQVGVMQEFPRSEKRRLRGELVEREAGRLEAERHLQERVIRRDAALAWLDLWRNSQSLQLTQATLSEAQTQTEAVEIAFKTGSATQAEFIGARLEAGRLQDAVTGAEQSVAHAQNALSRWIGSEAYRPVSVELPAMPELPSLETVLERVRRHPHLAGETAQIASAQARMELAKADYQPDWRVELGYANRPSYADEITLKVGIDLPVFTHDRQDRGLAAALAQQDAAESALEDETRQLIAEARLNQHDWAQLTSRLADYDSSLLPQSDSRIDAAVAGWRSGKGTLREVLDARKGKLDLQMARLELQRDMAAHYIQLTYLGAFDAASDSGEHTHE